MNQLDEYYAAATIEAAKTLKTPFPGIRVKRYKRRSLTKHKIKFIVEDKGLYLGTFDKLEEAVSVKTKIPMSLYWTEFTFSLDNLYPGADDFFNYRELLHQANHTSINYGIDYHFKNGEVKKVGYISDCGSERMLGRFDFFSFHDYSFDKNRESVTVKVFKTRDALKYYLNLQEGEKA